jgi:S-DNA-T family DNA segregation ATPase FtsK/SpoIIIE
MLIASGLFLALGLASFDADPLRPEVEGPDWVGPVGAVAARALVHAVGVVSWLVPFELMLLSRPLLADRKLEFRITRASGDVLVAVILASLVHIAFPRATSFGEMPLGGYVGDLFGSVMRSLFSTVGSYLIGLTVVGLILVERSAFSFIEWMQNLRAWLGRMRGKLAGAAQTISTAWTRARVAEAERRERERKEAEPLIVAPERADDIIAAFADEQDDDEPFPRPGHKRRAEAGRAVGIDLIPKRIMKTRGVEAPSEPTRPRPSPSGQRDTETPAAPFPLADAATPSPVPVGAIDGRDADEPEDEGEDQDPLDGALDGALDDAGSDDPFEDATVRAAGHEFLALDEPHATDDEAEETHEEPPPARPVPSRAAPRVEEPVIVDTSHVTKTEKAKRTRAGASSKTGFVLPSTELLEPIVVDANAPSKEQLHETARLLEKTLSDYKIEGKVQEIWPGPTVTMYEVAPAPGTKVSRVASLADDLALALARKVRIVAPIPGKNRIGFEVPNERRVAVSLRELFESKTFMSMDAPLPCVLGRDIIGNPCFADLSSMPHVIVAGATGAGKSVGLNVMLLSMLYRRTPEELRMLMIDPKVVELAPFDKIPHLLFPVVTDMKQAANALKWTVDEMERRYQLFADAGTRNIGSYNKWVDAVLDGEKPMPPGPKKVEAIAPDGTGVEVAAATDGSDVEPPKKLPFIVVVVDEFADLMMTHGKDVEASVARLAQKARAAGIHVILATQRPSVDVITGMIKANFPSRVAFRVVQRNDSATILDQQGAEHLLGKGDMLVKLNGTTDVRRVQCPFATEDEVQRVTDYLRTQGEPEYDESIVRSRDDDDEDGEGAGDLGDAENDPLYDAAVRVVAETRRATTSFLQRKLGVGYNRAAKIIETMEKRGVIGPAVGTRPREVLISPM